MNAAERRAWCDRLIRRTAPGFRQRWEIYEGILARLVGPDTRRLDAGCGRNLALLEFPCPLAVGMDVYRHPDLAPSPAARFVQGNLDALPFRDGAFTLVTLEYVAEHLRDPFAVFAEIRRVLAPGGHVLVQTTNIVSPLVAGGKIVPQALRGRIFTRLFGARDEDVFPAYHRLNTAGALRRLPGFAVEELHLVQDLNRANRPLFLVLLGWHLLSTLPGMAWLRTNMVVLLRKT